MITPGSHRVNKVLYGMLYPDVQTLTLLYTTFDRKGFPFYILRIQTRNPLCTLSHVVIRKESWTKEASWLIGLSNL